MVMACEVGNVEMVKMMFFRAIVTRFIYVSWVRVGLSRSNHLTKPKSNLNRVDKNEPKSNPNYRKVVSKERSNIGLGSS